MKRLIYIVLFFLPSVVGAQIPDESMAPNFEVTDVDGNNHELYDYLLEEHFVVIYFMATWNETSWGYHNGSINGTDGDGALITLHEEHGVENGGNVVVLMVEGDPSTNAFCLTADPACNFTTYGNWAQDTPFPVIESTEVAQAFEISDFPRVMTICPNGSVSETGLMSAANHWFFIENYDCPEMTSNDAALYYNNSSTYNCEIEETVLDLVNVGSEPLTYAHIVSEGGTPIVDFQWSGDLSTFETQSINFGLVIPNPGEELIFYINGEDENSSNDSISVGYMATVSSSHIRLELQSDTYPEDFSFFILDENNNVVVSDGDWGNLGPNALIERDYFLPDLGCYQVWLLDSWGDGLFEGAYCHAYGIDEDGNEMDFILDIGPSVFSEVLGGANVDQLTLDLDEIDSAFEALEIFPNPVVDTINLRFALVKPGATMFQLISPQGKVALSKTLGNLGTGEHRFQFDLPDLATGYYLMSISCDDSMMSERLLLGK